MAFDLDLIVLGAGPGGYIGAIRAAQLGLRVACIDAWSNPQGGPAPGGTCTNVGCIPSKALLQSSELFEQTGHALAAHGIGVGQPTLDLGAMQQRKSQVVRQNNEGILYLFKKNKIRFIHGTASLAGGSAADGWQVAVRGKDGEQQLVAPQVLIATGSVPRRLPGVEIDEQTVLSNAGALALDAVPKRLGIIGAGVIGLELGSVWRRLGAQVTLLEAMPEFLAAADAQIAKEAFKQFTRQGLQIHLGAKLGALGRREQGVALDWTDAKGQAQTLEVDKLIVAIGRQPNTEGLGAEQVGLARDARGFIVVDDFCRTNLPGIWAVGDVVRGPMLAHKAEEEGVAVAERIAGQKPHVDFATIPWVIYTAPEIAWVGQTEQQLKAAGRAYKAGSFPFAANGRARALGDTTGFVKMLADAQTDEILGVHIIGPMASELIAEAVVAMEFKASSEDIARICHAHPTLSEVMKEAALGVAARTLNL
ncbi:MAG: dihydrolipoyl dehydrogenase [Thiomonas sp.]|jgi:dihydrolipoamide dehydrogenase